MADYEGSTTSGFSGTSGPTSRWEFARNVVAALKSFSGSPWTTRGSSYVDNTTAPAPTSAHSSTPDGADYWAGLDYQHAASGGATVWHVLENAMTGIQVCFEVNPDGGGLSTFTITLAPNKFEVGGVWRGGGTGYDIRPKDVTSSPVVLQELYPSTHNVLPPNGSTTWKVVNRLDGNGFYCYVWNTQNTVDGGSSLYGVGRVPFPHASDPGPWFSMWANGPCLANRLASSDIGEGIMFRRPDGTLDTLKGLSTNDGGPTGGGALDFTNLDDYIAAYPAVPVVLYNQSAQYARGTLPDLFVSFREDTGDRTTWNTLKWIKLGSILVPWDGVTAVGLDRPFYEVAPINVVPTPADVTVDVKRFNRGFETL